MRLRALVFVLLVACTAERSAEETGILLTVEASDSVLPRVASLRVRVHSGDPGEDKAAWPERGDETASVDEWPAEVLILATDRRREWYAHVWALDSAGDAIAFGHAGGAFFEGVVQPWIVVLEACTSCSEEPDPPAGVDAGEADAASPGNVHDSGGDNPRQDAGADAAHVAPVRDSGPPPRDASPEAAVPLDDAAAHDAAYDAGTGDADASGPDAGVCAPAACTNTCLLSGSVRCCTMTGACGCVASGGTVCF